MLNGSITLTGIDNEPYTINPLAITIIAPASPMLVHAFGCDPKQCRPGASIVVVNSIPLQMADSPKAIQKKINRLKRAAEQHAIDFKKRLERSEWSSEDDYGPQEDDYGSEE